MWTSGNFTVELSNKRIPCRVTNITDRGGVVCKIKATSEDVCILLELLNE